MSNFPMTTEDWYAASKGANKNSLKDQVAHVLPKYIGDPELNSYLQPTTDADSVSGKLPGDQLLAARCLQHLAADNVVIAGAKTWDVMNAIKVVLRREGLSPKQRLALSAPAAE